jgi:hypothetical protein
MKSVGKSMLQSQKGSNLGINEAIAWQYWPLTGTSKSPLGEDKNLPIEFSGSE